MCDMCDGKTFEEVLDQVGTRIATYGWTIQGVEGSPGSLPWAYTIGLSETHAHPELVLTGLGYEAAYRILVDMVAFVERGERLRPGENCCLRYTHTRIGRVHPSHWRTDRFNVWLDHYGRRLPAPKRDAVQVLWSDDRGRFPSPEHPWREQLLLNVPAGLTAARAERPSRRRPAARRRRR